MAGLSCWAKSMSPSDLGSWGTASPGHVIVLVMVLLLATLGKEWGREREDEEKRTRKDERKKEKVCFVKSVC